MKKLITLAISALMVLSLGTTVFATSSTFGNNELLGEGNQGSQLIDVYVTVTDSRQTVYKVDLNWDPLEFVYTDTSKYNTSTHTYTENGGWTNDGKATVTVTNHSNEEITVGATLGDENPGNNVKLSILQPNSWTLASAEGTTGDETPSLKFTVQASNTPTIHQARTKVTELTVTID